MKLSNIVTLAVSCKQQDLSTCSFDATPSKSAAGAKVTYDTNDDAHTKGGWRSLDMSLDDDSANAFYAAGVAEGMLTCEDISYYYKNFYVSSFGNMDSVVNDDIRNFISENNDHVQTNIKNNAVDDLYWSSVEKIYAQLQGLHDGYKTSPCSKEKNFEKLSEFEFLLLNLDGDLYDLQVRYY